MTHSASLNYFPFDLKAICFPFSPQTYLELERFSAFAVCISRGLCVMCYMQRVVLVHQGFYSLQCFVGLKLKFVGHSIGWKVL